MGFILHQNIMRELQKEGMLSLAALLPPPHLPELAQYLCSFSRNGSRVAGGGSGFVIDQSLQLHKCFS